jgi:diadenosine tetraphosphate (Ap4A) HIT family hydrolase
MVRTPCSLLGRPRARLVGTRALETAWRACQGNGLRRINYEVLGNSIPVLHGHIHARYDWEPPDKIGGPVWRCPKDVRNDPECAYSDAKHGELRAAITAELQGLIGQAY